MTFYVIKIRIFDTPKIQKCHFEDLPCETVRWGYKPSNTPMVGYINMQKSLVEMSGLGNKSMAKNAN